MAGIEKTAEDVKETRRAIMHKYVGGTLAQSATGAVMGAALSPNKIAGAKRGALAGAANAMLWKFLTRGYAKAVGVPYKDIVA
jgi:hypothetical protein